MVLMPSVLQPLDGGYYFSFGTPIDAGAGVGIDLGAGTPEELSFSPCLRSLHGSIAENRFAPRPILNASPLGLAEVLGRCGTVERRGSDRPRPGLVCCGLLPIVFLAFHLI